MKKVIVSLIVLPLVVTVYAQNVMTPDNPMADSASGCSERRKPTAAATATTGPHSVASGCSSVTLR